MFSRSRVTMMALSAVTAVAMVPALILAQGQGEAEENNTGETPKPEEVLGLLASEPAVEIDGIGPPAYAPGVFRPVATHNGVAYYAGAHEVRGDERMCLIARRDRDNDGDAFGAASCPELQNFAEIGAPLDVVTKDASRVTAYLLPDGYAENAQSIPGMELVAPNLLVVNDYDALPEGRTSVSADTEALDDLNIEPIWANPTGHKPVGD